MRIVAFYVSIKSEHIAAYQHEILTKNEFHVPAFAYPVRKRVTKKGPDTALLDDPEIKALNDLAATNIEEPAALPHPPQHVWEEH